MDDGVPARGVVVGVGGQGARRYLCASLASRRHKRSRARAKGGVWCREVWWRREKCVWCRRERGRTKGARAKGGGVARWRRVAIEACGGEMRDGQRALSRQTPVSSQWGDNYVSYVVH